MNELLKLHKKYPEIIESHIDMPIANSMTNILIDVQNQNMHLSV